MAITTSSSINVNPFFRISQDLSGRAVFIFYQFALDIFIILVSPAEPLIFQENKKKI